jgi:hypothetical protein
MIPKSNSNYRFSNEDIESLQKYSNICLSKYENKTDTNETKTVNELDNSGYGFYCTLDIENKTNKKTNKYFGLYNNSFNKKKLNTEWCHNNKIAEDFNNIKMDNAKERNILQYVMTCTTSILSILSIYVLFKK